MLFSLITTEGEANCINYEPKWGISWRSICARKSNEKSGL